MVCGYAAGLSAACRFSGARDRFRRRPNIDFEFWLRKYIGEDVVDWVKENIHPLDIAFKLAEDHRIVLLNGSGFQAPGCGWSARVSFANLDDDAYTAIGRAVRAVPRGYVQSYRAANGLPVQP